MELTSFKQDFLLHNRERLKERVFLIDAMTNVASRPTLYIMDRLPTQEQLEYTINLLQLKEGRKYIQPSKDEIRSYPEAVQTWMIDHPESELIDQYDNVIELINHYQNYLALSQEQKELSDRKCKELHNRSNTELFQYYMSSAYNRMRFNRYVIRVGDVIDLYNVSNHTRACVWCSYANAEELTYTFKLIYLVGKDGTRDRILGETDTFELKKGDIPNFLEDQPITTTVGRYLLNQLLLVEPFGATFPYQNDVFTKAISDIESKIAAGMMDGTISVSNYKKYVNNLFYIGHFTELCVPTYSRKSLSTHPEVREVKKRLLEEHKDELNDPKVISEIENTLIEMDKEYLKGDSSMRFYQPLGDKPFNISRKKMYLTVGGVEEFTKGAGTYEFIKNSLAEGMTAEAIPPMANETRKGSFNRGDQTKLGGALTKMVIRVLQDLIAVDTDCHTTQGIRVDTAKFPISRYIWSYIWDRDKWTLLTKENVSQFSKGIQIVRSPLYCKCKTGLCKMCLGEMYAKLDKKHLALEAVDVTSTFTTDALKSMHGTKISMFEVTNLQDYIIH